MLEGTRRRNDRDVVLKTTEGQDWVQVRCQSCAALVLNGSYVEDGELETLAAIHFCKSK